jgi:predicted short-subunit dehydrogenase-like oxidoreductase (DUF2520 family)
MQFRTGIIGTGAVGTLFALRACQAGHPVTGLWSRDRSHAERVAGMTGDARVVDAPEDVLQAADIVFLTVPDSVIQPMAELVAGGVRADQVIVHTSGLHSLDVLAPLAEAGARVGSAHPLRAVADPIASAEIFEGTACFIEGDEETSDRLEAFLLSLEAQVFRIAPGRKALYHAGAVFASNFLVGLYDRALALFREAGVEGAEDALLSLVDSTLTNLFEPGLPHALTGPVARGDAALVRGQFAALQDLDEHTATVYKELTRLLLPIARAKGGGDPQGWEILESEFGSPEKSA